MRRSVRADTLVVGDVVLLPSQHGVTTLQIVERTPRAASIKFVGQVPSRVADTAGRTGWGWPPEQIVTRVRRAR